MLLLGAADPLRHGRLGNQECIGDFGRGQAADRPQGERDGGGGSEGGMAAHKEQDQRVVLIGFISSVRRAAPGWSIAWPTAASRRRRASSLRT